MKNKKYFLGALGLVIILVAAYFVFGKKQERIPFNPAFASYISAYTSGNISKESIICIRLANELSDEEMKKLGDTPLFRFSPSIKGRTIWRDGYTIEFLPDKSLKSGESYYGEFLLHKIMPTPKDLKVFPFDFQIIQQSFDVSIEGMKAFDKKTLEWQRLYGVIQTADVENPEDIHKIIHAKQNKKSLPIHWEFDGNRKNFRFTVDSIVRAEQASTVVLEWNGKAINVDLIGNKEINVPALGDFILTDNKVFYEPDQYLLLQFSDPLLENQNLDGLIRIGQISNLQFTIIDNEIRVYAPQRLIGTQDVFIDAGIQNILRYKLKEAIQFTATFEEIMPAVRLINTGVILPNTGNLAFPFEAANLKAVDVKVIKIFENNIKQFLQVNSLNGSDELRRVGSVVAKKTINLDGDKLLDLHKWNQFSLDLNDLIKNEPGAIYQISIGFKQEYSLYNCISTTGTTSNSDEDSDEDSYYEEEGYYSDDYNNYYYPRGYRWNQKDNPCHVSYYTGDRWIKQNVLASNLGLIAKKGSGDKMLFVVNDLKTTKPIGNATLEIYNYQNQLIAKGNTNSDGLAEISIKQIPYLLIASDGAQKAYLRLDDGSSLSLSKFDISGDIIQEGIKGFIYAERSVWRPGDTLHLMFMLEDKLKSIPAQHPVSLELYNPMGQLVKKMIRTESIQGIYNFRTYTSSEAPTGTWNVKIKIGGAFFQKSIRIETIMPNRLKINLDFGEGLYKDKNVNGTLQVLWLHGAAAKNLNAKIEATLTKTKTSFKKYPDYSFDDPTRAFEGETKTIFDNAIDENGKAKITAEFNTENAPGMLNAIFVTRIFEPGGSFSIDKMNVPYYPYNSFIGINIPSVEKSRQTLVTDKNYPVDIISVDQQGRLLPGTKTVEVQLYKIEWRWWWDRSDEDLTNYNTSAYHKPIKRELLTLNNGEGKYNLKINYPEWGRYLLRVCDNQGGHASAKSFYVDWGSEYAHMSKDQPGGATMLSFTSDKSNYNVGENVVLTIPTGNEGRAFISIESGSRIIQTHWVNVTTGQTKFEFKATQEMTPNVYVNVSLLQPHAQTLNDLPIRMYGIIPLMIEDPATKLQPIITMNEVLRPEEKTSISVSEKNGKEMSYTIAIVDEGLLDLTRFKTPDPWNNFYAREALGVKTWDLYDNVIGAWAAQLARMFSIGGDDYKRPKDDKKAKRFKPVVISLGPFHLEKGQKKTHKFTIPQYIGSIRAMVVAGYEGTYGSAEKTVPVRKPLMLLATLPRVIGPGETVSLPVNIFAMEKNMRNVTVEVQANPLFSIIGDNSTQVQFTEVGDKMVNFELKAKSSPGIGKVKIVARSGSEKAEYEVEIDVRNPNPYITNVIDTIIEAGQTVSLGYIPVGMTGTNKGLLEVSSFPPINLGKRIDYLVQYPYGCVEQTTSSVFPQLFLSQFMELSTARKSETEYNVKAGILRLSTFQIPDGGLAYWPGSNQSDEWSTTYAGHFMIEAQMLGYNLPPAFMDQWKRFQKKQATNWSLSPYERSTLVQAYRLYTLALAKAPELGAMNRLKEQTGLSVESSWCLAAAYQLAGQPEVAKAITAKITTTVKKYTELGTSYGSDLRDKAMILDALSLMGEKSKAAPLMKEISGQLSSPEWLSTQTTAYCLVALAKFIHKNSISDKLSFTSKINNESLKINTSSPFSQTNFTIKNTNKGHIEIKNTGKGMIFARILLTGQPETGQSQGSAENNLKIDVVYRSMDGKEINVEKLQQGSDFMAEVTVFNPGIRGNYEQMALSQIFPSGWEIHNSRLFGNENGIKSSPATYQDIRDDRVYTYFNINKNQKLMYYVLLNASYTGRFFMPSTQCEAMYDASINARVPGKWVEVVK
ncbi:MAG: MG2 domain-containing protein [Bacteroidales bacterium]|nr:MG2 domain-containing protein [Bacteroidales bacterium]